MKTFISKKWGTFKKTRFFLAILCLIIGATSTICFYEGKPLYNYINQGLIYTVEINRASAQSERGNDTSVSAGVQETAKVEGKVTDISSLITSHFGDDAEDAIKIAQCESSHNPLATNVNKGGSIDRGLFQINSKWHPEVSEECTFDPECNVREAKRIFDEAGDWTPWMCNKVIN